jgi:hypothetical protein
VNVCWAECLGGCSEKISREHPISRSLFLGNEVTVHGFPWCKTVPVKIGLQSFTTKILCTKHNSDLSDLDDIGADAFKDLREMTRLSNVRSKPKHQIWTVKRYRIDGPGLERWFLKTSINLAFGGPYRIGKDSAVVGQPSRRLVEIAFGLTQFQGGAGLYTVVNVGGQIQSDDTVRFAPLIQHTTHVAAGLFSFRGVRHLLFLEPEGLTRIPTGIGLPGEDWGASQLNFHNEEMRELIGKRLSQVVHFNWHGRSN